MAHGIVLSGTIDSERGSEMTRISGKETVEYLIADVYMFGIAYCCCLWYSTKSRTEINPKSLSILRLGCRWCRLFHLRSREESFVSEAYSPTRLDTSSILLVNSSIPLPPLFLSLTVTGVQLHRHHQPVSHSLLDFATTTHPLLCIILYVYSFYVHPGKNMTILINCNNMSSIQISFKL